MTEPVLQVDGVSRIYGGSSLFGSKTSRRALDVVSLTVAAGEIHALVGESGCGKSTLARIVAALDPPDTGSVLLAGRDLFNLSSSKLRAARKDVQLVFQDPDSALDPRWTIGRIVAETLHTLDPRPSKQEVRERVGEVLAAVGLSPNDCDRYPHEFSGGQRQRIAIARALAPRPKLLVADEAVSALDVSVQAQVLNLLLDLRDEFGLAVLFIAHDLPVVAAIADRVSVMHAGRIIESGSTEKIMENPGDRRTRRLLDAVLRLDDGLERIDVDAATDGRDRL